MKYANFPNFQEGTHNNRHNTSSSKMKIPTQKLVCLMVLKKESKCKHALLLEFILKNVFGVDDNMRNIQKYTKNL